MDDFEQAIYTAVARIPKGKVASYGQLAVLAGGPQWARKAGRAMKNAPAHLPCHRVVNSAGRLVPGWAQQRSLLENEGIVFRPNGCVDLRRCRWQPFG